MAASLSLSSECCEGELALSFLLAKFQEIARYKSYLTRASVRLGTSGGEGTMDNMSHRVWHDLYGRLK